MCLRVILVICALSSTALFDQEVDSNLPEYIDSIDANNDAAEKDVHQVDIVRVTTKRQRLLAEGEFSIEKLSRQIRYWIYVCMWYSITNS